MRFSRLTLFAFCCFCALKSWAQVDVKTSLVQDRFLLFEGIPLQLEITNNGDDPVILGGADPTAMLHIRVRTTRRDLIPRTDQPLFPEVWIIDPGETETRVFDLVQLFRIRHAMSFRAQVNVEVDEEVLNGPALLFDVSEGISLERIRKKKTDRTFELFSLNRNGRDEVLLRVSDWKEDSTLATYFLGRQLRFYPPRMKMGQDGAVTTLQYDSPNRVVVCRFAPDGSPIVKEVYQASAGVPVRLQETRDGKFVVDGATLVSP